jgi:hypothetical protein
MAMTRLESLAADCTRLRRKRPLRPELVSAAFWLAHAHLSNRAIATMLGCSRDLVEKSRRRMRPIETPPPGSARQRIRERLTSNQ